MTVYLITKTYLRYVLTISLFMLVTSFGGGDKKHKSGAKCTGSKYCNACKNCNYCKYCNAGGVCGVCSPESFEEKKKPATAPKPKPKTKTTKKQ